MRIKNCFLISILLLFGKFCYSQFYPKSKQVLKSEIGFIYYVGNDIVSFVSVKSNKIDTTFDFFSTSNLNTAIQLDYKQLGIDTLWQYAHYSRVYNYSYLMNPFLQIIPVQITYQIMDFEMSKKQFKEKHYKELFVLKDKKVRLRAIGGLPIKVFGILPIKQP